MELSNIYFYYYKVKFFVDLEEHIADGFTYGASWADAISHLVDYYGENELIEIIHFAILGEGGPCIEIEDIYNDMKRQNIPMNSEVINKDE